MKARLPQQRERIQQRLAATPVEELARGAGVNTAALRRGTVTTAADVHQRTVKDLDDIRDIGPKSAHKIKALAAELARTRPEDLRPVLVENSATTAGLGFHVDCRYSLISPASLARRSTRRPGRGRG